MIELKRVMRPMTNEYTRSVDVLETLYVCTFCGHKYSFFHVSPKECFDCKKPFPDMMLLIEEANYRMKYHFKKGE